MKATYYLRVRRYTDQRLVSVWLMRHTAGHAGLMHGQVIPEMVSAIAEATGLEVVEESSPLPSAPQDVVGCVPVSKQRELFADVRELEAALTEEGAIK